MRGMTASGWPGQKNSFGGRETTADVNQDKLSASNQDIPASNQDNLSSQSVNQDKNDRLDFYILLLKERDVGRECALVSLPTSRASLTRKRPRRFSQNEQRRTAWPSRATTNQ
jgi:hypothetical protein